MEASQRGKAGTYEVLEGFAATQPWLEDVREAADGHRNELGFFPASVYEQFARSDRLLVIIKRDLPAQYVGHLMFDRRFPRAHIRQMFISEPFRRHRLAAMMLRHLKERLATDSYISICARVAEDLVEANALWSKENFYIQRTELGGATRKRQILVRIHELDSPQLIPISGLSASRPFGAVSASTNNLPMFLLDMNVLFDVNPRRFRRDEVIGLFQAERMQLCRLAISDEIHSELQRSLLSQRHTDPMAAYIDTFPVVPVGTARLNDPLVEDLAAIVFPRNSPGTLDATQESDIRHLAATISNGLAGLVTNDTALLHAAPAVGAKYGVEITSAASVASELEGPNLRIEATPSTTLRVSPLTQDDEPQIRRFLREKTNLSGSEIASAWIPSSNSKIVVQFVIWAGEECIGFCTWPTWTSGAKRLIHAAIDEGNDQAYDAARILILQAVDQLRADDCGQIILDLPVNQSLLREVATASGFLLSSDAQRMVKFSVGRILTCANWMDARKDLVMAGGPTLPTAMPEYRGNQQPIQLLTTDGNQAFVPLDQLETLLSPTLMCLPGRPAVISPIQRSYSEPLFGHSVQGTLLPSSSASAHPDRAYISDPRTFPHFKRGALIFFYESSLRNGRKELVAVARVREAYLRQAQAITNATLKRSVLTSDALTAIGKSEMKTVTVFDNVFTLPTPVSLTDLKNIGCGRASDLITTRPISNDQVQAILKVALG